MALLACVSLSRRDHIPSNPPATNDAVSEVAEGVAHRSYGLNVARLAKIPRKVLEVAAKKSRELEDEIKARRLRGVTALMTDMLSGKGGDQSLDQLISGIEQL